MLGYGGRVLTNFAATSSPSASSTKPAPTTAAPNGERDPWQARRRPHRPDPAHPDLLRTRPNPPRGAELALAAADRADHEQTVLIDAYASIPP
jgi:hypothetical protein